MSYRFAFLLISATLLVNPAESKLGAQRQPALRQGAHIEVVSDLLPGRVMRGRLYLLSVDSLTLIDTTAVWELALEDIAQIRVNTGKDKGAIAGAALWGAVLGGVVAPSLAAEDPLPCRLGFSDVADCGKEVPDVVIGALAGGLGAGWLTWILLEERWVNVRLDWLLQTSPAAMTRVSLALRF